MGDSNQGLGLRIAAAAGSGPSAHSGRYNTTRNVWVKTVITNGGTVRADNEIPVYPEYQEKSTMATVIERPTTHRARFLVSLERCAKSEEFIPTFYANFMASSEEVGEKFKHSDFDRQHRMLLNSLRLAGDAVAGDPQALKELTERGETHSRNRHNIEPKFYELWLESLITAAHEFDELWNYEVEIAWRQVLSHVIRHMLRYY